MDDPPPILPPVNGEASRNDQGALAGVGQREVSVHQDDGPKRRIKKSYWAGVGLTRNRDIGGQRRAIYDPLPIDEDGTSLVATAPTRSTSRN